MSFKSIGTLAGTVLKQAELAVRSHEGAHTFNGNGAAEARTAPMTPVMDDMESGRSSTGSANERPMRSSRGDRARAMGMGKKAGAGEAPASSDREELRQTAKRAADTYGTPMRPALRLVMGGRGMSTAHRRQHGVPAPAVLRPMLSIVVGGRDHASTEILTANLTTETLR